MHHHEARELALLHLRREQLVEIELMAHVEERAGLVEQHHLRLLCEGARNGDALLLAAAEGVRGTSRELDEVAARERVGDDRLVVARGPHPRPLMGRSAHRHHLAHGEAHRELLLLLDDGEPASDIRAGERRDVASQQVHLPRADAEQPGRDADQGGLAGAVRPQHADQLASSEGQVDVLELARGGRARRALGARQPRISCSNVA